MAHCSVPQHLPCFSHLGFGTEQFILVVSEVNSLRYSPGLRAGSGLPAPALHLGDLGLAHTDDSTGPASGRPSSSPPRPPTPWLPGGASSCHVTPPPGAPAPSSRTRRSGSRAPPVRGLLGAAILAAAEGGKAHGICHLSFSLAVPPRALI